MLALVSIELRLTTWKSIYMWTWFFFIEIELQYINIRQLLENIREFNWNNHSQHHKNVCQVFGVIWLPSSRFVQEFAKRARWTLQSSSPPSKLSWDFLPNLWFFHFRWIYLLSIQGTFFICFPIKSFQILWKFFIT